MLNLMAELNYARSFYIILEDKWHLVARLRTRAAQNVIDCSCCAAPLSSNQSTWLAGDRWAKV